MLSLKYQRNSYIVSKAKKKGLNGKSNLRDIKNRPVKYEG